MCHEGISWTNLNPDDRNNREEHPRNKADNRLNRFRLHPRSPRLIRQDRCNKYETSKRSLWRSFPRRELGNRYSSELPGAGRRHYDEEDRRESYLRDDRYDLNVVRSDYKRSKAFSRNQEEVTKFHRSRVTFRDEPHQEAQHENRVNDGYKYLEGKNNKLRYSERRFLDRHEFKERNISKNYDRNFGDSLRRDNELKHPSNILKRATTGEPADFHERYEDHPTHDKVRRSLENIYNDAIDHEVHRASENRYTYQSDLQKVYRSSDNVSRRDTFPHTPSSPSVQRKKNRVVSYLNASRSDADPGIFYSTLKQVNYIYPPSVDLGVTANTAKLITNNHPTAKIANTNNTLFEEKQLSEKNIWKQNRENYPQRVPLDETIDNLANLDIRKRIRELDAVRLRGRIIYANETRL